MIHDESHDLKQNHDVSGQSPTPEQELTSIDRSAMIQEWTAAIFCPDDLVEVRFVHRDKPAPDGCYPTSVYRRANQLHTLVEVIRQKEEQGFHVFFGMNPRQRDLGNKCSDAKNFALARCLCADFDSSDFDVIQERIALMGMPSPSVFVNSGHGYHLYFRLDQPILDQEIARRYQQRLIWLVGSDAVVKDAARLLRVPATINPGSPPNKPLRAVCKLVGTDPKAVSSLAVWDKLLPTSAPSKTGGDKNATVSPPIKPAKAATKVQNQNVDETLSVDERCRRYLSKLPRSIQGQNGSLACFNAARVVFRDFAMPREDGMLVLKWYNRYFCDPPWSDQELEHKANDALKSGPLYEATPDDDQAANSENSTVDDPGVFGINRIYGTQNDETKTSARSDSSEGSDQAKPTEEQSATPESDWPEIIPLSALPLVPAFPVQVFPGVMVDYICEVAESIGSPVDFVALAAMIVAASEIGDSRSLFIKNGYFETCRIYGLLVGEVGTAKTHALAIPAQPLRNRHYKWKENYDLQMQKHRQDLELYEIERKNAQKEKRVCTESPPEKPILQQNHVDNFTVESLASVMKDNRRAMTVIKDEATGWLAQMNAYRGGRGDDRQFFLSCFTGQSLKVNRKNHLDGIPIVLPHPFLNILSTIQPDLLFKLCVGNVSLDGLLERFVFAFPSGAQMPYYTDRGISKSTEDRWQDLCDKLFLLEGTNGDHGIVPVVCSFTPEAKACWLDYLNNTLIREARLPDFPTPLKAYWSKLRMQCGRLALLLELLKNATQDEPEYQPKVSEQTAKDVAKLIQYFQSTYRRVNAQLRMDPVTAKAKRILQWIEREKPTTFKRYELYEDVKNNELFPDINNLDAPLAKLCDHHCLRRLDTPYSGHGRPPVPVYEVHPTLLKRCPENPENPENSSQVPIA